MSALTVDHSGTGREWDDLVRIWEETDAPEGCKVEIVEGIITVAPRLSNDHNVVAELLQRLLLGTVEYGGKLRLPAPFGLEIDTGSFPVR
nr:hypothetical protein [Streptomyces hundungensis]